MNNNMKEDKPKICPISTIVNSLFLDSPYMGKDWESVRKELITMFRAYTKDNKMHNSEIEKLFDDIPDIEIYPFGGEPFMRTIHNIWKKITHLRKKR